MSNLDSLKATATLVPEDLVALGTWELRRGRRALKGKSSILFFFGFLTFLLLVPWIFDDVRPHLADAFIFTLLAMLTWQAWRTTTPEGWARAVVKIDFYRANFLGHCQYEFDETGVTITRQYQRVWRAWEAFDSVEVRPWHLLLIAYGSAFVVIPRRSLGCRLDWDAFAARMKALHAAKPHFTPECPKCGHDLRGTDGRACSECGWVAQNDGPP